MFIKNILMAVFPLFLLENISIAQNNNKVNKISNEPLEGYIVVLKNGGDFQQKLSNLKQKHSVEIGGQFKTVNSFYVNHSLSSSAVLQLQNDPQVAYVERNQKFVALNQTLPTGINRIETEKLVPIGSQNFEKVRVAVIDTGLDYDHPDLNIDNTLSVRVKSKGNPFTPTLTLSTSPSDWNDGNGHGTHVGGTIAAIDNNTGVVGVAPGAKLVAVGVLDANGSGSTAGVIAGVNYVAQNASKIAVANMSLGGGFSQALNDAVTAAVNAGVVFVVAAGNESDDTSLYSPSSTPSAITVSAYGDSDGEAGALGPLTIRSTLDDSFADFSNFGSLVDMAAPGVGIYSTYKDGGYATFSGTSMASPHVAGAAALYIAHAGGDSDNDGFFTALNVAEVETALKNNAWQIGSYEYFLSDVDSFPEPSLNVDGLVNYVINPTPIVLLNATNISYFLNGGRTNNRNLNVTIQVMTSLNQPAVGALVAIDLYKDGLIYTSATGVTNSNGTYTYTVKNVLAGFYQTVVTNISLNPYQWDQLSPTDSGFTK